MADRTRPSPIKKRPVRARVPRAQNLRQKEKQKRDKLFSPSIVFIFSHLYGSFFFFLIIILFSVTFHSLLFFTGQMVLIRMCT